MTDEDALLKAICDHPDEDTPRLAFADWLTERGDPFDVAWASLIRAQVGLAAAPPGAERDALAARERVLATPFFFGRWTKRAGLPEGARFWFGPWERGFPRELSGTLADVFAARAALADRVPLRALDVGLRTLTELRRLLAWRPVRRLTGLSVYSNEWGADLGDAHAAELAKCEALGGLVALRLRYMAITDRGAADLLDSIPLRGVRELSLTWLERPGGGLSRAVRKRLRDRFGPHCLS